MFGFYIKDNVFISTVGLNLDEFLALPPYSHLYRVEGMLLHVTDVYGGSPEEI